MNWQPIETAPRDGTVVLVFCPGEYGGITTANYLGRRWYQYTVAVFPEEGELDSQPTRWQPLPAPPDLSPPKSLSTEKAAREAAERDATSLRFANDTLTAAAKIAAERAAAAERRVGELEAKVAERKRCAPHSS